MRIATYNIHYWQTQDQLPNQELVAETLAETKADVIGLNEVVHGSSAGSEAKSDARTSVRSALDFVADRLGMHYAFGPCMRWPAQDEWPETAFGNALLSRWPITASANHHLTPVEGKERRGLLEARVQLPDGTPFTCYVTHLDHTDEEARLVQWRSVREWTLRDRNRPHVLMGDFNSVSPWDMAQKPEILAALQSHEQGRTMVPNGQPQVIERVKQAGYADIFELKGTPGGRTYLPSDTPIRIDYLFASQPLADSVLACEIWESSGDEGSDHLPVVADVDFP